ncbi:hypothetical protein CEXT_670651 [Caerostris extrusa]|uniref:Uncharacterized protein n=1 Tax=Caerostris extrusa TaxID=172846 RepID=A0AAV4QV00_CAEEX|nr:hypothetical protein CEXT_670651 [Caerostris extrusa]
MSRTPDVCQTPEHQMEPGTSDVHHSNDVPDQIHQYQSNANYCKDVNHLLTISRIQTHCQITLFHLFSLCQEMYLVHQLLTWS